MFSSAAAGVMNSVSVFFFFSGTGEEKMDPHKSVVFGYDGVPAHLDLAIPAQYEHSLCFPLRHDWKGFKLSESDTKVRHLESGFKMVLMTLMLALMKVYFSLLYVEWRKWMPKNVIECWLKCKNRYWIWFRRKCSLFCANECIFALLVAVHTNECVFSRNEQQKV